MRSSAGWAGALILALLVATPAISRQDKKKPCPMTNKEPALYCEKCSAALKPNEIKDGTKCAKHGVELLKAEVCVRKHYICGCGKGCCADDKKSSGSCKCGKPLKEDLNKTIISYTCQGCGAASVSKDKVVHSKDCKKKEVKAACGHGSL